MECHRYRDRNVNSDHADLDLVREFPGRIAVAGEDRCAVAEFVLVDHPRGGVVVGSTYDRQDGPKNLFLVDLHVRSDMIKQRAADEVAILVALHFEATTLDEQLCTLRDTRGDVAADHAQMLLRDERA